MDLKCRDLLEKLLGDLEQTPNGPALSARALKRWAETIGVRPDHAEIGAELVALARKFHEGGRAPLAVEQMIALSALAMSDRAFAKKGDKIDRGTIDNLAAPDDPLSRLSASAQRALAARRTDAEVTVRLARADVVHLQRVLWNEGMRGIGRADFGNVDLTRDGGDRVRIHIGAREIAAIGRADLLARL